MDCPTWPRSVCHPERRGSPYARDNGPRSHAWQRGPSVWTVQRGWPGLPVQLLGKQPGHDLDRATDRPATAQRAQSPADDLWVFAGPVLVDDRRDAVGVGADLGEGVERIGG